MTDRKRGSDSDVHDEDESLGTRTRGPSASEGAAATKPALSVTLDPTSGPEHTPITITGTDFGDQPGTLSLNEVPAPINVWTPMAIHTIVPYGAKTGDVVVVTADGHRGTAPFTVTEPQQG